MKFGDAFASARKAGKKEFEWNGKMYHTRTKEEEAAKSKPAPKAETAPKATPKPAPVNPQTSKIGERYAAAARAGNVPGRRGSPSRNVPVTPPRAKGTGGRSAAAKNRTPAAPAPKKPVRRRTRNR